MPTRKPAPTLLLHAAQRQPARGSARSSLLQAARVWLLRNWTDALCSALFHAALALFVIATVGIAREAAKPNAYDYAPTERTLALTRAALDASLREHLSQQGATQIVQAALQAGRPDVARGALLALARGGAAKGETGLQAIVATLPPDTRAALSETSLTSRALGPREAALVVAAMPNGEVRSYAADELRALMRDSGRWLLGQPTDGLVLRLTGLQLISPGDDPLSGKGLQREAARLIRVARRSGKLAAPIEAHLRTSADAVFPEEALRAALLKAFAQELDRTAPIGIAAAFASAKQEGATRALDADLQAIAALQRSLPQASALEVLAEAKRPEDLQRLRLLAEAGGERLPALLAIGSSQEAWRAARGRLRGTGALKDLQRLLQAAVALALASSAAAGLLAWRQRLPRRR